MKDLAGSPGTLTGLVLRLFQCLFAAGSIASMASTNSFFNFTSFRTVLRLAKSIINKIDVEVISCRVDFDALQVLVRRRPELRSKLSINKEPVRRSPEAGSSGTTLQLSSQYLVDRVPVRMSPSAGSPGTTLQRLTIRIREKWENDDCICMVHILNGMSDSLFDVYTNVESAKELWDSLQSKYMTEDFSSKKFLVDAIAWWIDSGATTHVCKDRCWFKIYEPVEDGSVLYMGDDHFAPVQGKGSVALEFSSGKTITLFNVLYVPKLRKNLVSGPMLNKRGYKQVYESDKYILSKSGVFVGFGYYYNGVIHETTAPYTPQQNGVAERKNRALKEMVNSMLSYSGLKSRDEIFDDNRFYSIPRPKDIIPNSDKSQRGDLSDDVPNEISEPLKGKRVRKAKSYAYDFHLYFVKGARDQVGLQYSYCYSIEEDPRTYNEAMQSRDAALWKEASDDEIRSIMENNTWVLSDLPPGCKPLGCKWIFKKKMKVDGAIDKFKARLVIQGFRQKEGIDYFDIYAPVARITTIRLLLALVAIHNLVIHQMDVKTAFLNGDLDEEVYMKQPEGFVMPGNENKVCKLVKSLYGMKQAPKQWHQKFDEVVLSSDFHLNQSDKCVYSKFDDSGKEVLSSRFSMKDMGEADVILSIKIKRENKGIVIAQSHYIEKILKKFNREDCSPVSTPIDPVEKLKPNTGKHVDQLVYSRAIGFLMYAMTSTRPDIAYTVGRLSRFTSNPSRQYWKEITRIFNYLRGTKDCGLSYVGYPSVLESYLDASRINHVEDSSSTSGWVFLLGGCAISWASKKQTCITGSTMESEFVALASVGKKAEWLRNLIHEIPIWLKPIAPISIRCDSAPTMAREYSQIYNGKSRHLDEDLNKMGGKKSTQKGEGGTIGTDKMHND
nr:zinc finger, CCHC-type [Tanacetum cinerariifolium]